MKKGIICFGIAMACLWMPAIAEAGGINGNEASVISAARGTFEYEGEMYVAKDSYISQLTAELSKDGVDLTAEQASEAVAQIYSNVAAGVKQGYLQKVSGDVSASDDTSSKEETGDKNSDGHSSQNGKGDEAQDAGDENPADGTQTEGTAKEPDTRLKRPSQGAFHLDMDKALKSISLTEQSSGDEVKRVIQDRYEKPFARVYPIMLVVLLAAALAIMAWKKKGKWKKIWPTGLAMILLILGMAIGSIAAITEYGFCSARILVNQVAAEGYYNKVYTSLHQNTGQILVSAGFPEDVLDDVIDERTVYLNGKLALEAAFNSSRTREFLNIQEDIRQTLLDYLEEENYNNVSEVSDDVNNLAGMIQSSYADSLKFTYAQTLLSAKEVGQKRCNMLIGVGIILCIAALLVLLLGQHYIHRIFRVIGWSSMVPALATGGSALWYLLVGKSKELALVPGDYSHFFRSYLQWNAELWLAVAALEFVIFLVCVIMTLSLRKTHRRNPYQKIK